MLPTGKSHRQAPGQTISATFGLGLEACAVLRWTSETLVRNDCDYSRMWLHCYHLNDTHMCARTQTHTCNYLLAGRFWYRAGHGTF